MVEGGNDTVRGGSGDGRTSGGAGDDSAYGQAGNDNLSDTRGPNTDALDGDGLEYPWPGCPPELLVEPFVEVAPVLERIRLMYNREEITFMHIRIN